MRRRACLAAIAAGTLLAGCGSSAPVDPDRNQGGPRTAVEITLDPDAAVLYVGDSLPLRMVKIMSDGARLMVDADFSSPDVGVLYVDSRGNAHAVGTGLATVRGTGEGFEAFASVMVSGPSPDSSAGPILVHAFYVVESAYPGAGPAPSDWQWRYAPQLVVSALPGRTIRIIGLQLALPGVVDVPSLNCSAHLVDETPRTLNGYNFDIDDDELAVNAGTVRAQAGAGAEVEVSYVDESGARGTFVARGLIISSTFGVASVNGGPGACFGG